MNKKLTIGFFTDTYTPQVNGVVSSLDVFKCELERQGHKVYIFCPQIGQKEKEENIIRFKSFKFVFQPEYHISLPFSRKILKEFWSKELDIVHAHTPFSIGLIGYYYSYIKKVPFVYTYHTLYPEYIKSYVFKGKIITPKMVAKTSAAFSNRCDLNIAPSVKMKRLLKGYGVKKPIEVLPTGLRLNDFKIQYDKFFGKKYNIVQDDKVMVFVGRLGKEKNVEFLINSFVLIKKKLPNVKFLVIGDGPDKKELIKLTKKLDIDKQVVFTGYLAKEKVIDAYKASDLFVFASKTDTQGMVVLEAAVCGLPIVAVKDEAFSNILIDNKNGYFSKENKIEFSKKVVKILVNKNLRQKMSAESEKIAKQFSIEKSTDKLVGFYNNLNK